jgi:Uma2 family endonuclease
MATVQHLITAEDLFQMPNLGRCELIDGEINYMVPAGSEHGGIIADLTILLGSFVKARKLGRIMGAETGFLIRRNPDTVRAPDIAFIRSERLPAKLPRGFFNGPPDLAVEVLSPGDRAGEVQSKIRDWLEAGCLAVWVVDPENETVTVYKNTRDITVFNSTDILADEHVLPGFIITISEIFE